MSSPEEEMAAAMQNGMTDEVMQEVLALLPQIGAQTHGTYTPTAVTIACLHIIATAHAMSARDATHLHLMIEATTKNMERLSRHAFTHRMGPGMAGTRPFLPPARNG